MTLETVEQIAAAVKGGSVTAREVVEAALQRSERSQPALNAFTCIDHDGALAAANAVDSSVARGDDPGPLAGVPVAIKDLIDQEGLPNTRGNRAPPPTPDETAPSVARIEAAGGVVIGRAGLHEFAFGFSSENHWFGPVRNPWDLSLSPGGSSGGSAAAVSAGLATAALGTDTGGSVRVPAALCGIVGLKVTHGRVPLRGVYPLAPSLDTVGPLGRTVADCAAVYRVIAGDDPHDPWSVPIPVEPAGPPARLEGLRVGVPHPWVDTPLSPDQESGFGSLLGALADQGAEVIHLEDATLGPSPHSTAGSFFEVALVHKDRFASDPGQYGPEVRDRVAAALDTTGAEYLAALEWRREMRAAALRALQTADVLVTPSAAITRKEIGKASVSLGGENMHYVSAASMFSAPVNHIGFPALAVPLPGVGAPPPSAQIIGPPWSEARILEIGLGLEIAGIVTTQRPPHWCP